MVKKHVLVYKNVSGQTLRMHGHLRTLKKEQKELRRFHIGSNLKVYHTRKRK